MPYTWDYFKFNTNSLGYIRVLCFNQAKYTFHVVIGQFIANELLRTIHELVIVVQFIAASAGVVSKH
jgi:hypothetical protein